MRSYCSAAIVCTAVLMVFVGSGCTQNVREKRFLRRDFLNPLTDSLVDLSEMARDFTGQATAAVQSMVPLASRAADGLTAWGSRVGQSVSDGLQKRGLIRVPVEREIEGEEVEVFAPEEPEGPPSPGAGVGGGFNPFIPFQFSFGFMKPWWDGPNICIERSEVEEAEQEQSDLGGFNFNFETTRCVPSDSTYTCTRKIQSNGMRKTVVIKKQCCHGFVRRTDGRPGCSALKMETVLDTLKAHEMTKFVQWVDSAALSDELRTENRTVFSPSNEAIADFEDDTEDNEISAISPARRLTDIYSTVKSHIVEGFVNLDTLENEHLLNTLDGISTIRINKYQPSHEVITANCVPISGKNNFATNGIVHLTSDVLQKPRKTIGEIIEEDNNLSSFKNLLIDSGLLEKLKKDEEPWTLFVPTNEAFRKLPQVLKKQIESGEGCIQSILYQHMVKGTVCTSAVVSRSKVRNILENLLQLTKDVAEKLRIEGSLIETENVLGTNGVIHVIDKVLVPSQARSLLKALEEEERNDLLELIELSDMVKELEDAQNVTFFIPSKEALKGLSNETREEMLSQPEELKKILRHHLIQSQIPVSSFTDNKKLTTTNGHDVHMKLHETFPGIVTSATVQCAYVMDHDKPACGAVIHKINKVLMPPRGNIIQTLKHMGGHETVLRLLKNTDLQTKLEEDGPFTFLAPTDEAFEKMEKFKLLNASVEELMENNTLAEEILRNHILPETLCCNGVAHPSPFVRQYVRTLDGTALPAYRGHRDRVIFGRARVEQCDKSATNGLVHSINRVILVERPKPRLFGVDLWPFF